MSEVRADLYPDLHNARERLCGALASSELLTLHRAALEQAIHYIDEVGIFYCPQWSRYDELGVSDG